MTFKLVTLLSRCFAVASERSIFVHKFAMNGWEGSRERIKYYKKASIKTNKSGNDGARCDIKEVIFMIINAICHLGLP